MANITQENMAGEDQARKAPLQPMASDELSAGLK